MQVAWQASEREDITFIGQRETCQEILQIRTDARAYHWKLGVHPKDLCKERYSRNNNIYKG